MLDTLYRYVRYINKDHITTVKLSKETLTEVQGFL